MKLENIGFYTLSDQRAKESSCFSPMWRCEMILTSKCNFSCPYCRKLKYLNGDMPFEQAKQTLDYWISQGLKNVRFSGGEPTLYEGLECLVSHCRSYNVERIAISTNGSSTKEMYENLIANGVNDFSVSLDACCSSTADKMSGKNGFLNKILENIRFMSSKVYTTVGVVVNNDNLEEVPKIISLADSLGVSDIRIIPAAQYAKKMMLSGVPSNIVSKHPILNYRAKKRVFRGISVKDSHKCHLVKDDSIVCGEHHFPCVIYMREQGNPIGKVGPTMRQDRMKWFENHDSFKDPICRNNCLDVCVDYNNKCRKFQGEK